MKFEWKKISFTILIVLTIIFLLLLNFWSALTNKEFEQAPEEKGSNFYNTKIENKFEDTSDDKPGNIIMEDSYHPEHDPIPIASFIDQYVPLIELGEYRLVELSKFNFEGKENLKPIVGNKIQKIRDAVYYLQNILENPDTVDIDKDQKISEYEIGNLEPELSNAVFDIRSEIYLGDDKEILEKIYEGKTIFEIDSLETDNTLNQFTGNTIQAGAGKVSQKENKFCQNPFYVPIIIEGGLFNDNELIEIIDQYISVEENREKYCLTKVFCNDCTEYDIKDYLIQEWKGNRYLSGALFMGVIPHYTFFLGSDSEIDDSSSYVTDLFFMDLDGVWEKECAEPFCKTLVRCSNLPANLCTMTNQCKYDNINDICNYRVYCEDFDNDYDCEKTENLGACAWVPENCKSKHLGDINAEIFVSRFYPPFTSEYDTEEIDKTGLLQKLLLKIINAKKGKTFLNHNAMWFQNGYEYDSEEMALEYDTKIGESLMNIYQQFSNKFKIIYPYSDLKEIKNDPTKKHKLNFFQGLYQNQELGVIEMHGQTHSLDLRYGKNMDLFDEEFKKINPFFYFVISGSCGITRFYYHNYIGGHLLFNPHGYILTLFGNNDVEYTYDMNKILDYLSENQDFGIAYKNWLNYRFNLIKTRKRMEKRIGDYRRSLIGDPFLKLNELYPSPEYFEYVDENILNYCTYISDSKLRKKCCDMFNSIENPQERQKNCICSGCWFRYGLKSIITKGKACYAYKDENKKIDPDSQICSDYNIDKNQALKLINNCGLCLGENNIYKKFELNDQCKSRIITNSNDNKIYFDNEENPFVCIDNEWEEAQCWATAKFISPSIKTFKINSKDQNINLDYTEPFLISNPDYSYPDINTGEFFYCKNQKWVPVS